MMKITFIILLLGFLSFDGLAQDERKKLLNTRDYYYNGWKITERNRLALKSGDSITIGKLTWYNFRGTTVVYATALLRDSIFDIDLAKAISEDVIKHPKGIKKMPPEGNMYGDELIDVKDILLSKSGMKIFVGQWLKFGLVKGNSSGYRHIQIRDEKTMFANVKKRLSSGNSGWTNLTVKVTKIAKIGNPWRGYDSYIIFHSEDLSNDFYCNIDKALEADELVIDGY